MHDTALQNQKYQILHPHRIVKQIVLQNVFIIYVSTSGNIQLKYLNESFEFENFVMKFISFNHF